jgi:hypothetical protein
VFEVLGQRMVLVAVMEYKAVVSASRCLKCRPRRDPWVTPELPIQYPENRALAEFDVGLSNPPAMIHSNKWPALM